jgi:hypothetical protein
MLSVMSFQVVLKNFTTMVSDSDIKRYMAALQIQVTRDFAPLYGSNMVLRFAPTSEALHEKEWLLGIYNDADQAGALGYHDLTAGGTPLGKVFAKTTYADGGLLSVVISHELLEMGADPWINLTALDPVTNRLYAYEVCDAVEADDLGYDINSVRVSDFVKPHFFTRNRKPLLGELYSFNGKLAKPFSLDPGGYLSYIDLDNASEGWQQVTADRHLNASSGFRGHSGTSRGARRRASIDSQGLTLSTAP